MMPVKRNHWLPGIFNDFFGNEWLERQSSASPAVNIMENETEYKVEVAAPGLTRDDFKIELEDDNHLVISMEKQSEKSYGDPQANMDENTGSSELEKEAPQSQQENQPEKSQDKYLRREFSYSSFRQSMILPDNVNVDKIEAKVSEGILTLVIPKTTEEEKAQKAKTIEVK